MLLDENMPRRLKRHFAPGMEVVTVQERGWGGKKNGELLREAQAEFDALVTTDRGIPHQQNLSTFAIGIVLLEAASGRFADLVPLMPRVNEALRAIRRGELVRIAG